MYSFFFILPKSNPYSNEHCKKILNQLSKHYKDSHVMNCESAYMLTSPNEKDLKTQELPENNYGHGFIIGTLFHKNDRNWRPNFHAKLNEEKSTKVIKSEGTDLSENYFGRYVAIIFSKIKKKFIIMRDPSGSMPCYYYEDDLCYMFFSNGSELRDINLKSLTLNTAHIATFITSPIISQYDSGFVEIKKLAPGQAAHIIDDRLTLHTYWHPAYFCERSSIKKIGEIAEELRETVLYCVHSWASLFDHIIMQLSGGLDSSIVLACLRRAPTKPLVTAHTYYSFGINCDERESARRVAEFTGTEIIEVSNNEMNTRLEDIETFTFGCEPVSCRLQLSRGNYYRYLMKKINADAFFSGEGGDSLFYQGSHQCLEDYIMRHGLNLKMLKYALENSIISKKSIWSMLKTACLAAMANESININKIFFNDEIPTLLSNDALSTVDFHQRLHYQLSPLSDQPSAKILHIFGMNMRDEHRWHGYPDGECPRLSPLLSQPVVELCCRIPTYMFPYKGVDRGLARLAFYDLAPKENILRQSKGDITDFTDRIFMDNFKFLREYLLDGLLVKYGLYDRKTLEKALVEDMSQNFTLRIQILESLPAEAWLRYWKDIIQH